MRSVRLSARVPAASERQCFDRIGEFARYPELVDVIQAVAVYPEAADGTEHSDWEVYFRNGILRWSERDWLDREASQIRFEQTDGDFECFSGQWSIGGSPGDPATCAVSFEAEFDFGIPSLAGILDPVAERVFKETIARVLIGLFGEIEVIGDADVTRSLALLTAGAGVAAVA
jgi:ribosome-associated toxin RatA of RatAB toxin-antitoxin module